MIITAEGVRKIQKALLAAVILGFLSIYFCTMCDWIIMSAESTTRGLIQYEGGGGLQDIPRWDCEIYTCSRRSDIPVKLMFRFWRWPNSEWHRSTVEGKCYMIWNFVCFIPSIIYNFLILLFRYWRSAGCIGSFPPHTNRKKIIFPKQITLIKIWLS